VITYVVQVREGLTGTPVEHSPVDVAVGNFTVLGTTTASVVVDVVCPVPNNTVGGMTVVVMGRDGAGNAGVPVQSNEWVRDTVPPVTEATLAQPALPGSNVSVTNTSTVLLMLNSPDLTPVRYQVTVTSAGVATANTSSEVLTLGGVGSVQATVPLPWDGPVAVAVVRSPWFLYVW
jgi:hypothetical protein